MGRRNRTRVVHHVHAHHRPAKGAHRWHVTLFWLGLGSAVVALLVWLKRVAPEIATALEGVVIGLSTKAGENIVASE